MKRILRGLTLKPNSDKGGGLGSGNQSHNTSFFKPNKLKTTKKNKVRMSLGGDITMPASKIKSNQQALEQMLTRKGAKLSATNTNYSPPLDPDPQYLPVFLFDAMADVEERGIHQEGIFRKSSKKIQEDQIMGQIRLIPPEKLHQFHIDFSQYSDPYLAGNMIKKYLRSLEEPLLTFDLYHTFLMTQDEADPEVSLNMLKKACRLLPASNYELLKRLCRFLRNVSDLQKENFMTADNLALCWQPNLLYMRDQTPMDLFKDSKIACRVIVSLIENCDIIFAPRPQSAIVDAREELQEEDVAESSVTDQTSTDTQFITDASVTDNSVLDTPYDRRSKMLTRTISDLNVYSGDLNEHGERHGKGKLMLLDGRIFTGDFVHNHIHGKGEMVEPNGSYYSGDWKDGMKHGKGTMHYPDKCRYEGSWKEDQRCGRGIVFYPDGSIYDGQWFDDKPNGTGIFIDSNECKYVGEWHNGKYHGKGTLQIYTTKEIYEGQFVNGEYEGLAKYTSTSLSGTHVYEGEFKSAMPWNGSGSLSLDPTCVYTGEWREGQFFGHASMNSFDGRQYEGEMAHSQFHGEGTMQYPDGSTYTGSWRNGKRHGEGVQKNKDGTVYDGDFKEGMFDGLGTLTSANGQHVFQGEFKIDSPWEGEGVVVVGDDIFDGAFKKGMFFGQGRKKNADGSVYDGEFQKTEFHGNGKLYYPNGSMFEGEFRCHQKYIGVFTDKFGVEYNVEYDLETGDEVVRVKNCARPSDEKRKQVMDRKIVNIVKKCKKIEALDMEEILEPSEEEESFVSAPSRDQQFDNLANILATLAQSEPNHFSPVVDLLLQLSQITEKLQKQQRKRQSTNANSSTVTTTTVTDSSMLEIPAPPPLVNLETAMTSIQP